MGPARRSVSVAVNFDDDRDYGHEALTSWRKDQGYDGPLEIVAVSNSTKPELDDAVRTWLLPEDQLVVVPGSSRIGMYDAGVRAAKGDIVVITEAHCAAEPGCLGRLVDALEASAADAALGDTIAVGDTALATIDAEIFERGQAVYGAPDDWRKVVPHSFAIYRDTFVELGGFEVAYDLFAEQLFAATMRRAGRTILSVPDARVRHRFSDDTRGVLRVAEGYGRGQALAKAERAFDELDRQLFPLGFLEPTDVDPHLARSAAMGAALTATDRRDAARWVVPALLPLSGRIALDTARLAAARVRCRLRRGQGPDLERDYLAMTDTATRRSRLVGTREAGPPARDRVDRPGLWPISELADHWSGCHDIEDWHGQPFRWTEPTAAFVTDLPPGDWILELHTGGFGRDPRDANVRIALDGRRLEPDAISVNDVAIFISVTTDQLRTDRPQCWVVATDPLELSARACDQRRLGVTIIAAAVRSTDPADDRRAPTTGDR